MASTIVPCARPNLYAYYGNIWSSHTDSYALLPVIGFDEEGNALVVTRQGKVSVATRAHVYRDENGEKVRLPFTSVRTFPDELLGVLNDGYKNARTFKEAYDRVRAARIEAEAESIEGEEDA